MADYFGMILTNSGKNLFNRAQTGEQIRIKYVVFGDGLWDYSSADGDTEEEKRDNFARSLTSLVSEKMRFPVSSAVVAGDVAKVTAIVSNDGLQTGFMIREVGLICEDPVNGDILYAVTFASNPDYMPADDGVNKVEYLDTIYIAVGQADNVTVVIDGTVILATQLDIEAAIAAHNIDPEAHPNLLQGGIMDDIKNLIGSPIDDPNQDTTLFAGQELIISLAQTIKSLLGQFDDPAYPTVQKYLEKLLYFINIDTEYIQNFDTSIPANNFVSLHHIDDPKFARNVKILEKLSSDETVEYSNDLDTIDDTSFMSTITGTASMSNNYNTRYKMSSNDISFTEDHIGCSVYAGNGQYLGHIAEIIDEHNVYISSARDFSGEITLYPAQLKNSSYKHILCPAFSFREYMYSKTIPDEKDILISTGSETFGTYEERNSSLFRRSIKVWSIDGKQCYTIDSGLDVLSDEGKNLLLSFINDAIAAGASYFQFFGPYAKEYLDDLNAWYYFWHKLHYTKNGSEIYLIGSENNELGIDWLRNCNQDEFPLPSESIDNITWDINQQNRMGVDREMLLRFYKVHSFPAVRNNTQTVLKTKEIDTTFWDAILSFNVTGSNAAISFDIDGVTKKFDINTGAFVECTPENGHTIDELNNSVIFENITFSKLVINVCLLTEDAYVDKIDIQYHLSNTYKLANNADFEIYLIDERNTKIKNITSTDKNVKVVIEHIKKGE